MLRADHEKRWALHLRQVCAMREARGAPEATQEEPGAMKLADNELAKQEIVEQTLQQSSYLGGCPRACQVNVVLKDLSGPLLTSLLGRTEESTVQQLAVVDPKEHEEAAADVPNVPVEGNQKLPAR